MAKAKGFTAFFGNMQNRVVNPIINGRKLYSLDNSKSGDASITCANEKTIIINSYSVLENGNIDITIQGDLNLDGNIDYKNTINNISGICAEGIIIGQNNFYYLKFNGSEFYLKPTTNNQPLPSCYCINDKCSSISRTQKRRVLGDFGGVIAQSLKQNNSYVISNIQTDNSYSYVIGKSINCNGKAIPVGSNDSDLENAADNARNNSDENSSYYVIEQTAKNINDNPVDANFTKDMSKKAIDTKNSSKWNKDSGIYSYDDTANGTVSGGIYIGDVNNTEFCEISYKKASPDVFYDKSNRKETSSGDIRNESKIIACQKDSTGNWFCPIQQEETIKHDCGKVDEFGEVIGTLSAIDESTNDFTCSSK